MGKLSSIYTRDAIKAFERAGFEKISQQGSHLKMRRDLFDDKTQTIIIPCHKLLKEGTLKNGILKPINMTTKEFLEFLK